MKTLEDLKAAYAAATQGEWKRNGNMIYAGLRFGDEGFDPAKTQFERIADVADRDQFNYDKQLRSADNAHLIALMHNALPALIECAERLNELLAVINTDRDDGYFICEEAGPVIAGAHAATLKLALAKLENHNA